MGKAEIPEAPIKGLILLPDRTHMILPSNSPAAVSRLKANNPMTTIRIVLTLRKLPAVIVEPMVIPSRMVTMFTNSF